MAVIDYDKSPNISTERKIQSLADSTRRALEENKEDNNEQINIIKTALEKVKEAQESQGGTTGGDKHYTHNQTIASTTWEITHNLGKHPSVEVVDSAGTVVVGDVRHIDTNSLTITFKAQFKGKAYLN